MNGSASVGVVGKVIVAARKRRNLSQKQLSEATCISRSYLCDIEKGRAEMPSLDKLRALGAVLGTDIYEAIGMPGAARCKHWAIQWRDGTQREIECRDCGQVVATREGIA